MVGKGGGDVGMEVLCRVLLHGVGTGSAGMMSEKARTGTRGTGTRGASEREREETKDEETM